MLGSKCEFLISWEIFSVPGGNWISSILECLIGPYYTPAQINTELLFTFGREEHIVFDVNYLSFFGVCVKNSSLQTLELNDPQRGFPLI